MLAKELCDSPGPYVGRTIKLLRFSLLPVAQPSPVSELRFPGRTFDVVVSALICADDERKTPLLL